MFIKNENNDVINIARITAVTFHHEDNLHEMRVYTPQAIWGIPFRYGTKEQMQKAADSLEKMLIVAKLRLIQFANWWLMAKEVDSISAHGDGLKVRMIDGHNFDIILRSRKQIEAYQKEINESLASQWALKDITMDDED